METPNYYFRNYVKRVGSRREAASRLGIGVGQVGHILCGRRSISARVAQAIDADTGGEISKAQLRPDLWGGELDAGRDRNHRG